MCGITAIIDRENQPIDEIEIQAANNMVKHRGPDASGYYFGANFALGHRRLAVLDLSEAGNQPMTYEGLYIIFNGEVYNYLEIRRTLIENGYSFQSDTDTEVILAAYHYWGYSCVEHFNGMWAFIIYDPRKNILFCSRDRFGIKPFYYSKIGKKTCFVSEIKQFSAIKEWRASMNRPRAYEFIVWGYHDHSGNETLFENVYQLPKGHHLIYDLDTHSFEILCYYKVEQRDCSDISWEEAKTTFKSLFLDAVKLRIRSDVKIGSALSGGLDSSSIVGAITKHLEVSTAIQQLTTVSACFDSSVYDESFWIDKVAKKHHLLSHKVYPTASSFLNSLRTLTWHQDEPIIGAGVFAQYKVFETARREGITVMVDGQGADEILAGYNKFYYPFLRQLIRSHPQRFLAEALGAFFLHRQSPGQIIRATYKYLKKNKQRSVPWISPQFIPAPEDLFGRSSDNTIQETSINLLYEMGISILLHYEDRNSMASSVESRLPFLDHRLVEFCLSLPSNYKIKGGKRKYLLRESMKAILPSEVYNRYDKMGYATPQSEWMKDYQEDFHHLFLNAIERADGFFSPSILETKDQALQWRCLALGVWLEVFDVEI